MIHTFFEQKSNDSPPPYKTWTVTINALNNQRINGLNFWLTINWQVLVNDYFWLRGASVND